jgi:hypothetical protein
MSDKWISVNDKVKFRVDYLTPDQAYKLEVVRKQGIDFKINYSDDGLPIISESTEEQKSKFDAAWDLFIKRYLKYVIKDWSGVVGKEGKEIPCNLINNELDDRLWNILCSQSKLVMFLFIESFTKVLRWSDNDKKKFISQEDSNLKADLKEEG